MHSLHAPWRLDYVRSLESRDRGPTCGCFLCDAAATPVDDLVLSRKRLVLWHSALCVCLMNRYPYASGHLLIAPREHFAELDDLPADVLADLGTQTARAVRLVRRAMSPQGFNLGINLGRAAGAGLPAHLHQHVIARWAGDVNFISVVGDLRIIPHATEALWEELRAMVDAPAAR